MVNLRSLLGIMRTDRMLNAEKRDKKERQVRRAEKEKDREKKEKGVNGEMWKFRG